MSFNAVKPGSTISSARLGFLPPGPLPKMASSTVFKESATCPKLTTATEGQVIPSGESTTSNVKAQNN